MQGGNFIDIKIQGDHFGVQACGQFYHAFLHGGSFGVFGRDAHGHFSQFLQAGGNIQPAAAFGAFQRVTRGDHFVEFIQHKHRQYDNAGKEINFAQIHNASVHKCSDVGYL